MFTANFCSQYKQPFQVHKQQGAHGSSYKAFFNIEDERTTSNMKWWQKVGSGQAVLLGGRVVYDLIKFYFKKIFYSTIVTVDQVGAEEEERGVATIT